MTPGLSSFETTNADLYRIDTQKELDTLALDDLRSDRSILLIEWGEKFARFRDECDVEIAIERLAEHERKIAVNEKEHAE